MPIDPKYKDITYSVVSVDPCITDDKSPIKLSGPYVLKILVSIARVAVPEIGLISARGNISIGRLKTIKSGLNKFKTNDKNPLFIKILTLKIIARKVGNKFIVIPTDSFAPSKNAS